MDCALVDLVSYHFGSLDDAERERVDEHLMACSTCLRAYLTMKHRFESVPADARPRDEVRLRLRAAVERKFQPRRLARARAWLARPIPLYQGLAAAALAVLLAALGPTLLRRPAIASGGPYVDTARSVAESVGVY